MQTALVAQRPESQRARGVGRAVVILPAGIIEVKMIAGDSRISLLAGVVMAHRRIAARGGDSGKTLLDKARPLLAEEKLINKVSFMVCVPPVTIPPRELVYMLSYVVNTYKTAGKTYLIKIDEDEYTPNKNTGQ